MKPNYQQVIADISIKLANEIANNAILEDVIKQQSEQLDQLKMKYPNDFESDNNNDTKKNSNKIKSK